MSSKPVRMASRFQTLLLLRRAAPRLSRRFFTCQAPKSSPTWLPRRELLKSSAILRAARLSGKRPYSDAPVAPSSLIPLSKSSPTLAAGSNTGDGNRSKAHFFPETSDGVVAYWLLGSAASVFGLVVFGGLTRLTESGLSITEWRPVTGSLPPTDAGTWDSEFTKYMSSPEFKLLNPNMTLEEFKSIYWMEWIHRLWGRVVGLTFAMPALYFIARRRVSAPMAAKILGITGLIGFQGFIGWWMVKSGLKDDLFAAGSHPRVSQYRLTTHLGTAFICYSAMLWNGLSILREHRLLSNPAAAQSLFHTLRSPELAIFRRSVAALLVLVFCTAMSGGLVAGLDAGLIYNEFPYMGLGLTPPKSELFSDFYSHRDDKSDIWWRNVLENPSLVQLDHRIMATTSFTSIMALWAYSSFSPTLRKILPATCRKGVHGVVGFAWLQVILGISTLLYLVPLPLASAHQAGSLALLSWIMVLGSRTWVPSHTAKLVAQKLGRGGSVPKSRVSPISPKGVK